MSYSDSAAERLNQYEAQVLIDAMSAIGIIESRQEYLDNGFEDDYAVDVEGELVKLAQSVNEFRKWAEI